MILQKILMKRSEGVKRNRQSHSLETAKTVLVLYDASEEYQNKIVESFLEQLKNKDLKVKSLGFIKYNIIPHYCIPQFTKQFLCKKDLNLLGIPKTTFLDDFLHEEFDLLISLDLEQSKVLQYIACLSKAKFKVGWNDEENLPYYDFLIKSIPGDLEDYIRQIIHYLSTNKD